MHIVNKNKFIAHRRKARSVYRCSPVETVSVLAFG